MPTCFYDKKPNYANTRESAIQNPYNFSNL